MLNGVKQKHFFPPFSLLPQILLKKLKSNGENFNTCGLLEKEMFSKATEI